MNSTTKPLRLVFSDYTLGVIGYDYHAVFSYQTGGLESLRAYNKEWIYRTPKPTFWRAVTDNDRGNLFFLKSGTWLSADTFIWHIGTDVLVDNESIELPICPANNVYCGNERCYTMSITFHYKTITVPAALVDVTYVMTPTRITVDCQYHGEKGLPQLPVFGMRFIMPTPADGFTYEGLSGETYPDRMKGAKEGVYEVEGMPVTPYLVPQDCGMHMNTHRLTIRRTTVLDNAVRMPQQASLTFSAADNKPFAFSCLPYTAQELDNALHIEELPPVRRTVLCIYGAVRGIGGIDSWGSDVEPAYHVSAENDLNCKFNIDF